MMGEAWKTMLGSKKFQAALGTIAFMALNGPIGLNAPEPIVTGVIALAIGYMVGQGVADMGKEAAKVKNSGGGQ